MDPIDGREIKNNAAGHAPNSTSTGGSNALNNFGYAATTSLSSADICQMCLLLGIQVMCPNEATKRKHTDDHRRAAAAFLSLEDWALPPTEAQLGKCFPQYAVEVFQQPAAVTRFVDSANSVYRHNPPPLRQQAPQQQRAPPTPAQSQRTDEQIQRTVAAILFSSASPTAPSPPKPAPPQPRLTTAESREASISEAVAAVAANTPSIYDGATPSTSAHRAIPSSKKARPRPGGGAGPHPKKRSKGAASLKNGQGANSVDADVKEQFTKSVIAAIESSVASGEVETNFQLVRDKASCKWPRFIIDGYAYRVGRVYSTGKCELRCILKQGCNGKAVVEKNGAGYTARIVPGSVHFHSPPTFAKQEPEIEKSLL